MSKYKIVPVIFICIFLGCGSRKMHKSEQELSLKTNDVSLVEAELKGTAILNKAAESTEREARNYNFNQGRVTPVDPGKPVKYTDPSGKTTTVENGILEFGSGTDKTVTDRKNTTTDNSKLILDAKTKSDTRAQQQLELAGSGKDVDRKGAGADAALGAFGISFLVILVVVLIIIVRKKIYDKTGT